MKKFLFFFACFFVALAANGQALRFDLNGDGEVNTSDVVVLYNYIATGEGGEGISAPSNVQAKVSGKTVVVSWTAVPDATAYTVYRSADGKAFTALANNIGGNSFTDKAPLEGYNYYAVTCIADGQTSDYSAVAKVKYEAGIESGLYMGVMCFNDELYTQPITLLNDESKATFNAFIDNMTMKNATILCYSVDQALDALKGASLPKDLSKVALVTFTDGLDRGSTMLNYDYDSAKEYLAALQDRITNEKVKGFNIDAYSIGLRGADVEGDDNIADFHNTLRQLASSESNAKEVNNMAEVNAQFIEIAEQLSQSTIVQSVQIVLSGISDNGTKVRFTLDNASSAESSNIYIEGTYIWTGTGASRVYQLTDVTYHGFTTTSGSTLYCTRDGVYVSFSVENIVTEDNRILDNNQFDEWDYKNNSTWTHNSEWEPDRDSKVEVEKSSAVIMLVLDCSSSLGNDFSTLKSHAKDFISKLHSASNSNAQGGNGGGSQGGDNGGSQGGNKNYTVNGVQFTMVGVQGGTFQIGSTSGDSDEKPVHSVTLSSYYIGQTEVTQALWKAVMGNNPSNWKGDDLPVERVSWYECQEFITKLNALTGEKFRLPTEAEWEFAARGGNKSKGYTYSGSNTLGDVAWYYDNSSSKTHPVGTKAPNELGIYDMSGNVWEWCQDWYGSYSNSAQTNPTGPASGSYRVVRGGSWDDSATGCRTAYRSSYTPSCAGDGLGFRLAL